MWRSTLKASAGQEFRAPTEPAQEILWILLNLYCVACSVSRQRPHHRIVRKDRPTHKCVHSENHPLSSCPIRGLSNNLPKSQLIPYKRTNVKKDTTQYAWANHSKSLRMFFKGTSRTALTTQVWSIHEKPRKYTGRGRNTPQILGEICRYCISDRQGEGKKRSL